MDEIKNETVMNNEVEVNEEKKGFKLANLGTWIGVGVAAVAAVALGAIAVSKASEDKELHTPEDGDTIEVTDEDIESIIE